MLIFVTGGVRSGKSAYAEQRAVKYHGPNGNLYYVATSHVYDSEMAKRVTAHQLQRKRSSHYWNVIEKERQIEQLLTTFHKDDVVLVDCLTTLLSNELFFEWEIEGDKWKSQFYQHDVFERLKGAFLTMKEAPCHYIIVSNEIFFDIPLKNEGSMIYIKLLGKLHQVLVKLAEEVILVEFGLPKIMKGGV
ncbi:bifunctional adenosylcobinamide kinase/adenosylcobinamide-phosphate guanylyltransferase [Halalkalibacter urbisdiaboli]|uniref:bifunctional adenosylcobinamide kinase/adenosylcobinamide-phosphate guanylyltransferase n=1 Tax=Halalkalibacter urbisdiaboli TaxID=1960589 RepID=UPI0013FD2164|nr:bifunctional adenosylcobinamide kinase/adenosylcobinamide-phosphate guanylyltransferase [Halalkalibacter urbisdiaboli]